MEVIRRVQPAYPRTAVKNKLQGVVVIKATVSPAGDVTASGIESGDPALAQAASDAVKSWKFRPFIRNGAPVPVSTSISFNFLYRDKDADDLPAGGIKAISMQVVWLIPELASKHKIKDIFARYPEDAKRALVQGNVVFLAAIGQDGSIRDLQLLDGHPMLAPAAAGAVKQWRYRPYTLGGTPVEVQTTMTVSFELRQ